jgi:hypothetical protein
MKNLQTLFSEAQAAGSVRLFSVRHEFPTEWAKFQRQTPGTNQRFKLALDLRPEHYPFWSQEKLTRVKRVDIFASSEKPTLDIYVKSDRNDGTKDSLEKAPSFGNLLVGKFDSIPLPVSPIGERAIEIFFDDRDIKDIWIAITWSSE